MNVVKMASVSNVFPKWLLDSKEDLTQTKEWNSFLGELHDAIQQQLTESHVQYFTDLSEAEKTLFMERAIRAIENGGVFGQLYSKVSVLLDQHLNEEVARALMEEHPVDTKSDLVVASAEEGVISLLKKWPEMRSKLHICLNQPLPLTFRQLAWKLFLQEPKVRKEYVDILSKNARVAISSLDLEISQKCEYLLNSEPTFAGLKGSVGAFYGMKAVLSYHHARTRSPNRLPDIDYMLIVPFVEVASPGLSRREPAPHKIVVLLVEEYLSFMAGRPGYMVDSGSELHNSEMKGFVDKVAGLVEKQDPDLTKSIAKNFVAAKEKIVTTEAGSHRLFVDGLESVIRPIIRAMFVGYLKMDTLLYVWDQYMIGLDTPAFSNDLLSVIMATMLFLLRDHLLKCHSSAALESVLQNQGPKLTVAQFQYEVKSKHYKDLYGLLEKDNKSAMPVLDPTQGQHPPWRHWFNDLIPPYQRPQDRRRAREEREAERDRLLQQQREAEKFNREQDLQEKKEIDEEYMRLVAEDKMRAEDERRILEEQLEQERRQREEDQQRAQEELDRLRMEIDVLKDQQQKKRPQSTYSVGSYISRVLVPPPPTAASRVSQTLPSRLNISKPSARPLLGPPPREDSPQVEPSPAGTPAKSPSPARTPQQQTEDAILDFLRRISYSVNKIGHGEGTERLTLDQDTKAYMKAHVKDIKRAEMEIFERNLEPGEFERLSPDKQKDISDQMMELVQQYRQERSHKPQRGKRR